MTLYFRINVTFGKSRNDIDTVYLLRFCIYKTTGINQTKSFISFETYPLWYPLFRARPIHKQRCFQLVEAFSFWTMFAAYNFEDEPLCRNKTSIRIWKTFPLTYDIDFRFQTDQYQVEACSWFSRSRSFRHSLLRHILTTAYRALLKAFQIVS